MTTIFMTLFFVVVIAAGVQLRTYVALQTYTEDALAESNLASATVDLREYGMTHHLVVGDTDRAYQMYLEALKVNMGLTDSFEDSDGLITGSVDVAEYIVYNVRGTDVDVAAYGDNPYTVTIPGGLGTVTAPNGAVVESTSIYSRVTYQVSGYFGITVFANKDKLVDIVRNN